MKLHEIVSKRAELSQQLKTLQDNFKREEKAILVNMEALSRFQEIALTGADIEKVQIAESILSCYGACDTNVEGRILTQLAAIDIANGCKHLKKGYYGNKRYGSYYQSTDCEYGMGPSHGTIVDEVGLRSEARKRDLTDDEKDACIYYLLNYSTIEQAVKSM